MTMDILSSIKLKDVKYLQVLPSFLLRHRRYQQLFLSLFQGRVMHIVYENKYYEWRNTSTYLGTYFFNT